MILNGVNKLQECTLWEHQQFCYDEQLLDCFEKIPFLEENMMYFKDQKHETTIIIQKNYIGEIKKCSHSSTQLNTSHTTLISLFQMDKKGRKEYNGNFIKMWAFW